MSKQRVLICPNMLGPEGVNKVGGGERGIPYSRKFSLVQIFAKILFPLWNKFSRF